jgi:hypothetical protein
VADLLNHATESSVTWYTENSSQYFSMYVGDEHILKGKQIFNNYGGDGANAHTMLHYGFVQPNNKYNLEKVFIPDDGSIFRLKLKRQMFGDHYIKIYNHILALDLFQVFRILVETDEKVLRTIQFASNDYDAFFGAATECTYLLSDYLESHPPNIGDEYSLLSKTQQGSRAYTIITYRIERKKVFHRTIEYCQMVLSGLMECLPQHMVKRPRFLKSLLQLAEKYFN